MVICKIDKAYQSLLDNFDCGNFVLNSFIKSSDAFDSSQGITYLLLDDESSKLNTREPVLLNITEKVFI